MTVRCLSILIKQFLNGISEKSQNSNFYFVPSSLESLVTSMLVTVVGDEAC